MLSKAAFNALLKTLEEPPGHVTFILATTEPEKFPQTILSRCQHFVFKRLPQARLAAHLDWVLAREGVAAEAPAVHLIARRGAGSVRDSMSLLSQVLALGSASLTLHDVREVLGLAGQEVFVRLVECVHGRDLLGLHALLTGILDQGVDLGFFCASWLPAGAISSCCSSWVPTSAPSSTCPPRRSMSGQPGPRDSPCPTCMPPGR